MKVCLLVSSAVLSLAAIGSDAHGILQGLLAENVGSVLSNDVDKAFLGLEIGYMRGIDAADIHHMVSERIKKDCKSAGKAVAYSGIVKVLDWRNLSSDAISNVCDQVKRQLQEKGIKDAGQKCEQVLKKLQQRRYAKVMQRGSSVVVSGIADVISDRARNVIQYDETGVCTLVYARRRFSSPEVTHDAVQVRSADGGAECIVADVVDTAIFLRKGGEWRCVKDENLRRQIIDCCKSATSDLLNCE